MYKLGKVIGVACIIFGIIAMIDGIRGQSTLSKLETQGKQVTGKVHQFRSIQGNIQTYIDYPVAEEKRVYRQIFILPQPISKELKIGDEVPVAYLPEQPRHAIAGENGQTIGMAVDNIPVAVAIFIIGIFALIFSIRKGRENQRQQRSEEQLAWLQEVQDRVKERAEQKANQPPEDPKPDDTSLIEDEPEEPSPYPPISPINFNTQDPLKFQVTVNCEELTSQNHIDLEGADLDDELSIDCELSIEYEPREPEECHVLKCRILIPDREENPWEATSLIHADNFYLAFQDIGENNLFISKLSEEERTMLETTPAFGPFENMDDGRDYFDISVSGQKIELRTKYLGMSFHLIPDEATAEAFWVVVSNLYDSDANLIPDFVCQIPNAEFLFQNDARYDADDELWYAEEPNTLKFEQKQ